MDFVGAQCCMEMKKYAEASLWSDLGLAVSFLQTSLLVAAKIWFLLKRSVVGRRIGNSFVIHD